MGGSWLIHPLPLRERGRTSQLDPSDKAVGRAQPPHPNPLPQGEREPEVPSTKGVTAISTVLPLSRLHQAFTCVSARLAALTNGRYQSCPFFRPIRRAAFAAARRSDAVPRAASPTRSDRSARTPPIRPPEPRGTVGGRAGPVPRPATRAGS